MDRVSPEALSIFSVPNGNIFLQCWHAAKSLSTLFSHKHTTSPKYPTQLWVADPVQDSLLDTENTGSSLFELYEAHIPLPHTKWICTLVSFLGRWVGSSLWECIRRQWEKQNSKVNFMPTAWNIHITNIFL